MGDDNQALLLQISADLRKLEKAFEKSVGVVDKGSSAMEKRARRLAQTLESSLGSVDPTKRLNARLAGAQTQIAAVERQMLRSSESIKTALLSSASALAAGFGVVAVTQLADSYTRFSNQLKVAGLEGAKLVDIQDNLFDTAQEYGVALESLGGLYGRTSQGAKELGASNADLLRFTDGVAAALKVQGGSAESTSGAVLQLTQALGGAVVRAEEFNSINEGARPILQAVADNIDRYGGSVAKLRADVILGKVTSQEFFQAFLKGVDGLKGKAEKSVLTISASLQVLNNALSRYVGEGDQTLSATAQISKAIKLLADNLDIVVPAIAVLATVIGSRLVVSLGQAAAAAYVQTVAQQRELIAAEALTFALNQQAAANARLVAAGGAATAQLRIQTASMGEAALAARGAGAALLGAFGGPIGLAITAVTVALGAASLAIADVDAKANASKLSTDSLTESIEAEKLAASIAAQEQGKLPDAFGKSEIATASLTGEVNKLGDAHYRTANAAKTQRLEEAQLAADAARKKAGETRTAADNQRRTNIGAAQFGNANLAGLNSDGRRFDGGETRRATEAADNSPLRKQAVQDAANADYLEQRVKDIKAEKLETFLPKAVATPTTKKGKKTADTTGRENSAERRSIEQDRRIEDELFRAGDDLLRAQQQRALTAQQALDLELTGIARDEEAMKTDLDRLLADRKLAEAQTAELLAKKKISAAEADDIINAAGISQAEHDRLLAANEAVIAERRANATREGQNAIIDERARAERQYLDLTLEILGLQSESAKTTKERRRIELESLAMTQKAARDQLDEAIRQDQQKGAPTFDYDRARGELSRVQAAQTESVKRRSLSPLEQWRDESLKTADEIQEAYERVAVDGLDRLTDGIVGVITGTKDAAAAFSEMATSIIADLARIAVQKYITGPLSDKLFGTTNSSGDRTGGWLDGLFGGNRKSTGSLSSNQTNALKSAPSFEGGGYTGSGARSGGVDGKGGFMALLHPQETVTDHAEQAPAKAPAMPDLKLAAFPDFRTPSVVNNHSQSVSIALNATYQIEGAVGKDELAAAIQRSHVNAVREAVGVAQRQLPANMAKLQKYGA